MRVVNQITFTAKDDAEALRLASERLGRNAVILSTRAVSEISTQSYGWSPRRR